MSPGWWRTGQRYRVDDAPAADLVPVCRFYTSAYAGKPSHFFTASAAECESAKGMPDWTYEGVAFYARVPDAQGNCGADTAAIHRLYNADRGGAPNHAYTADLAKQNTLAGAGWVIEGVAFCTPLARPDPMAQVTLFHNAQWYLPSPAAFSAQFDYGKVMTDFLPVTTANVQAAFQQFQDFQIAVPAAVVGHAAATSAQSSAYGSGVIGGAGWDPIAGEYVMIMPAGDFEPAPYGGIMWTFDDPKSRTTPVCTMGIAMNYGVKHVDATSPRRIQPFLFSGCKSGVAKRFPDDQ